MDKKRTSKSKLEQFECPRRLTDPSLLLCILFYYLLVFYYYYYFLQIWRSLIWKIICYANWFDAEGISLFIYFFFYWSIYFLHREIIQSSSDPRPYHKDPFLEHGIRLSTTIDSVCLLIHVLAITPMGYMDTLPT